MSKKEVQRSVYLQVGIVFLLPVIVGMIHSVVAMNMLEQIMNVRFTLPILSGIGLFVLIMLAFISDFVKTIRNWYMKSNRGMKALSSFSLYIYYKNFYIKLVSTLIFMKEEILNVLVY